MQSITTLHLSSNQLVGIMPALAFPSNALPHLASLSLERICFNTDDGPGCAESFILLHRSHLTHLTLAECPLYGHDRTWARPWAMILEGFAVQMTALRSVTVRELEYADEDEGWGIMTHDAGAVEMDDAADKEALRKLVAVVEARNLGND